MPSDELRASAEGVFRAAMVMFEHLPEGAHEDAPYGPLTMALVQMRKALDAPPDPLKAAAPDLLAALKSVLAPGHNCPKDGTECPTCAAGHAAIAKAEGRAP